MNLFSLECTDPTFETLRDSEQFEAERTFLEGLFQEYHPRFSDKNFVQELERQFHPRFWEMYLACVLRRHGHDLVPKKEVLTAQTGPDVCIRKKDRRVWLEAHAPGPGESDAAVPPEQYDDDEFVPIPVEEIILRYTHSVHEKSRKYDEYITGRIIDKDDPFVVAINGGCIPFFHAELAGAGVRLIVQATLGVGEDTIIYDPEKDRIVAKGLLHRDYVSKNKGDSDPEPISTVLNHPGVSGVLYSPVNACWAERNRGNEFIYVHNTNAKTPLDKGWLTFGREFWRDGNRLNSLNGNQMVQSDDVLDS